MVQGLLLAAAVLAPALALPAAVFHLIPPRPASVPIKGRHVFVTGGSYGIGLAIAKRAAAEGAAKVSLLARGLDKLEAAREEILRDTSCREVAIFSVDVRDEGAVKRAVEAAGPIDVLICNHGVFFPIELENQDTEEIKLTLDVNLMGNFHLIKAALPTMKAGASASAPVGIYGYAAYSASKFALRGLAESLQQELIGHNVHVSLVFPPTPRPPASPKVKRRPEATAAIASSSGAMTAAAVAEKVLGGIKAAAFTVTCNLEGIMLSLATAGMSSQRSWAMALAEILGSGFMRFLGIYYQYSWYRTIVRCQGKQKSEKKRGPTYKGLSYVIFN
ncbi:unnamed protein product [Spirodela intermedia]|uniref:Uncharacterized protein n=1 Tax=Spirodela intermedia TaxID=51605 RepID=A0A7I8INT2_SPIIN|nr:unnamed protein product [Spirodela intermedia]CAA6659224.1 unnamed protein product [Spirodela intermedia]CAA6675855.1 unnamed protein product [Spirodela intermedia]